jgi:hypothetical protein
MKTKILLSFAFLALIIIFAGCKKEVPPVELPKAPEKITEQEFVKSLKAIADEKKMKVGETLTIFINQKKVAFSSATQATVMPFKSAWEYSELKPVLKQIPLTLVWVGKDGSKLLILNYEDFLSYKKTDNFVVLEPKPKYSVEIYNGIYAVKYWLSNDGDLWRER